ncbi:hypothetical protein ACFVFT_38690 [Streptomyces tendae]|uniref:hypothetical protein n=1 Tax=Streptomyces tendae TaxID=1932 RepID=UPI0036B27CFD
MSDPLASTVSRLIKQIRWARAIGHEAAARQAIEELLALYVRLGKRELGTVEEQNDYIVARHLGYLPGPLRELGVIPADLPEPPGRRRPPPPPADPARIAEHLAHTGPDDESQDRFVVRHRPEDNKRFKGRLCPWAIIDRDDGKPVAWYYDRDFAEMAAEDASRMRTG